MAERPMPQINRSNFPDVGHRSRCEEFRVEIRHIIKQLLRIPLVKNRTQREEALRAYAYALPSRGSISVPYDPNGVGSAQNNVFKCLCAELTCAIKAFWKFEAEPGEEQAVNDENVADYIEYLDQIVRDPDTVRTTGIGVERWRIINDRIYCGMRMRESKSDCHRYSGGGGPKVRPLPPEEDVDTDAEVEED